MRFEAAELLKVAELQHHPKYLLIEKITKVALASPFESFKLPELKELATEDVSEQIRQFQQKFVDEFKLAARFKIYMGYPRDFATPDAADRHKNSVSYLLWKRFLSNDQEPLEIIHLISSYLKPTDMPQKKPTPACLQKL